MKIGDENTLITTGDINSIFLSNLIFSEVGDQYPTDDANYMIVMNVIKFKGKSAFSNAKHHSL